jgi:hypothetical protein
MFTGAVCSSLMACLNLSSSVDTLPPLPSASSPLSFTHKCCHLVDTILTPLADKINNWRANPVFVLFHWSLYKIQVQCYVTSCAHSGDRIVCLAPWLTSSGSSSLHFRQRKLRANIRVTQTCSWCGRIKQFVVDVVTVQFDVLPRNRQKRREALLKLHNATKTHWSGGISLFILNFRSRQRWRPALSAEKTPQGGWVSPTASLDAKENPYRESSPDFPVVQHVI